MLVIRKEQLEALRQSLLETFVKRMMARLRSDFPEATKGLLDKDLRTRILAGIDRAETYGVTDEADVERYLEYVVRYGPDFDTSPRTYWVGPILQDKTLSGTKKMNKIDDYDLFGLRGGRP